MKTQPYRSTVSEHDNMSALQKLTTEHTEYTERARFMNKRMGLLQKLIIEHIGRAERARFIRKRVIFFNLLRHIRKFFTLYFAQKINLSLVSVISVVSVVRRLPFCSEVEYATLVRFLTMIRRTRGKLQIVVQKKTSARRFTNNFSCMTRHIIGSNSYFTFLKRYKQYESF